jgi:hypothetical protein
MQNEMITLVLLFWWTLFKAPQADRSLIREEKAIIINGVPEVWRLEWKSPQVPECGALDEIAFTCESFAYGEAGELDLVRLREGHEYERLSLTPFFHALGTGKAIVPRWAPRNSDRKEVAKHIGGDSWRTAALQSVQRRPAVSIMKFADYDHDGRATEFFIQTESLSCGKAAGIVVGISRTNGHLHVLESKNREPRAHQ